MTLLPKEYKPAPRWRHTDYGAYMLDSATDDTIVAQIWPNLNWQVRTRNRAGGWNYGYSASLRAAKRKAAKMMREEAT